MSEDLWQWLIESGRAQEMNEWLALERGAANCYMTILAGNLAQNRGLALLTDEQRFEPLSSLVRRGEAEEPSPPDSRRMGEAVLAHLALQTVNVTADTPVKRIIEFRRKHRDELARFRQATGRLASQLNEEFPSLEAFQQEAHDVYVNDLEPALNALKASLSASRIRNLVGYLKTLAFSSPLVFLPAAVLAATVGPLAAPVALFAGGAFSITAQSVTFRLDRQKLLRENPHSYVLAAERAFGEREA